MLDKAEEEMWGGRAKLMAVVMVWETVRTGKEPGRATETKRDVSGFLLEEIFSSPYHMDIFVGMQDSARMPLPLLRESWPTFAKCKTLTIKQAGHLASTFEPWGLPKFGLRWNEDQGSSG